MIQQAACPEDAARLTRDLCRFATGVCVPDNRPFFERLMEELPLRLHAYPSGSEYNGWIVSDMWRVEEALVIKNGRVVFDGRENPLGVAALSRSFEGILDLEALASHVVTDPHRPEAYVYHCMWQYRPWAADWALSIPHMRFRDFGPGRYEVRLRTVREPGEMLVADCIHPGRSDKTIVLNAHTCHPCMANDDFAGVAVLVRLFQWLREQDTYYTYRLVLGPEHLGTVFYLRDLASREISSFVGGYFLDMPATAHPLKIASSFLGSQAVDRAMRHAARMVEKEPTFVPWRKGAGNDETVWEAPGYEVPFVEVTRCGDQFDPYPEYHSSLDTAESLHAGNLKRTLEALKAAVDILEKNSRLYRTFDGLICLSNPHYDLYFEREDPAVDKGLTVDAEKWGHLLDSLFRYLDGSRTILDIAEAHDLPFDQLYDYLERFRQKELVRFEFESAERRPVSRCTDFGA